MGYNGLPHLGIPISGIQFSFSDAVCWLILIKKELSTFQTAIQPTMLTGYPVPSHELNRLILSQAGCRAQLDHPLRSDLPKDCSGVIQVDDMSFVCCGDFKNSALFTDMKVDIVKDLSFKKTKNKRGEERDKKLRDWEHSPTALVGSYNMCEGYPISLYVNVGRK